MLVMNKYVHCRYKSSQEDTIEYFSNVKNPEDITECSINGTSLNLEIAKYFSRFKNSKKLFIIHLLEDNEHLDNLQFIEMPSVTHLYLHDTFLSDNQLQHVKNFKNLKFLNINNTLVTSTGIDLLKKSMPNLEIKLD